jgi:TonB-linked SusC/RagA family outer membrane protein
MDSIFYLKPKKSMKKLYSGARRCLFSVLWLAASMGAWAQERTVSGTVKDENGTGMPGVNVLIKGTALGTATDANGQFRISVPTADAVLVFSFVGYTTREMVVGGRSNLDVSMELDVQALSEVVVIGYGAQEKKDITGAVGIVRARELIEVPTGNVANQLQGRVAGVNVINSGQPGAAPQINIRGNGGFGGNNPLFVVDGVYTLDISTINPNDVETMTVLKDAGAAAIYGTQAANGVVLITTKRGQAGRVRVTYDAFAGGQSPGRGFTNLLNSQEMANLQWLVFENGTTNSATHPLYGAWTRGGPGPVLPTYILPAGAATGDPAADPALYRIDLENPANTYQIVRANQEGTNWFNEATRAAPIQNHDITLSGGSDKSTFLVSMNYFEQQGIVRETFTQRYSIRANSTYKVRDNLRIGQNLQATYVAGRGITNQSEGNAISQSYRMQPIVPVYDIMGSFAGTRAPQTGNGSSPVADLTRAANNIDFNVRVLGNVYAEYDIMKDLTFRSSFGGSFQNRYFHWFSPQTFERAENIGTSTFSEGASYAANWVWTNTLNYRKSFGQHHFTVLGGYESQRFDMYREVSGIRGGYFAFDPNFHTLNTGATVINANSFAATPTNNVSQFGRIDYNYNEKYYLTGTLRRDGSSRFGGGGVFGVFPSLTAAWRISEEDFFSGITFIDELKIRGGYGVLGNQFRLGALNQFSLFGGSPGSSAYDIGGTGNSAIQGFRPTRIGNPNARWERATTTNIGFDAELLGNRLQIGFDYYVRKSDGLLFAIDQVATQVGGADVPSQNVGAISNRGIELQVGYRQNFATHWRFETNIALTTINNRVDAITVGANEFFAGGTRFGFTTINRVGDPTSAFFGYQVLGLFQNAAEVAGAPVQDGAAPGRFRFADLNGDGRITPLDRTIIGDPNPDFTLGINLTLGYKNFDFTTFLFGAFGQEIFNYTKWWTDFWPSFQGAKSEAALYNSWTPERPNATTPRAENVSNFSTNLESSSYYIEPGGFLRSRNMTLGYTLPATAVRKIGLERLRLYVQGANLFTITRYSGLDPELQAAANVADPNANTAAAFGIDFGNYPVVRQLLFGINVGF